MRGCSDRGIGQLEVDHVANSVEGIGIRKHLTELVRRWAGKPQEGWQAVQERPGLVQSTQERRQAPKVAQEVLEGWETLQRYCRVLTADEVQERSSPDREYRDRFNLTRNSWSSGEVVAELPREVFGPTCEMLLDARDGWKRSVLPAKETPDQDHGRAIRRGRRGRGHTAPSRMPSGGEEGPRWVTRR